MEIEKAIEILKEQYTTVSKCLYIKEATEQNTAINLAISALEKQIPKKPREKHYEEEGERPYIKYKCPSCESKYQIHNFIDSYCNNCGQKLDWR